MSDYKRKKNVEMCARSGKFFRRLAMDNQCSYVDMDFWIDDGPNGSYGRWARGKAMPTALCMTRLMNARFPRKQFDPMDYLKFINDLEE